MKPEERARLEEEIRNNNFVTVDDIPYTPTQLALLNWHKLDEIHRQMDQFVTKEEFKEYRNNMLKMSGMVITLLGIFAAVVVGVVA